MKPKWVRERWSRGIVYRCARGVAERWFNEAGAHPDGNWRAELLVGLNRWESLGYFGTLRDAKAAVERARRRK